MPIEHDPSFNPQEQPFKFDQQIKVKRTSGDIEDDWTFIGIEPNSGMALVSKKEGKDTLRKSIDVNELKNWQQETGDKQTETTEKFTEDESKYLALLDKLGDLNSAIEKFKNKLEGDEWQALASAVNGLSKETQIYYRSKTGNDRGVELSSDWIKRNKDKK